MVAVSCCLALYMAVLVVDAARLAKKRAAQGSAATCTSDDYAQMDALGVDGFSAQMANCGRSSLNWLFQWQPASFIRCAEGTGLSSGCAGCYEGAGKYGYDNCKIACMAGWCTEGCLSCTARHFPELEQCVGRQVGGATPCGGALVDQGNAVTCTSDDYAHMDALGVDGFSAQMANCGRNSLNWLFQWQPAAFIRCAEGTGLSNGCANCFEGAGKYGYDNCKIACLAGWCTEGCLSCTERHFPELEQCLGREPGGATPCGGALVDQGNKATCTSDDYAHMDALGVDGFSAQMATCGRNSLNWLFQWQSAAFIRCAEGTGLSNGCANCYEGAGKYGYDNCKIACMAGWCTEGCLSCTARYFPQLEQCVGREVGGATPC